MIPLTATHADDLRRWVKGEALRPDDYLLAVPEGRNLSKLHRKHVRQAGVEYLTDHGFADHHSLRKSLNTFLRRWGVSLRVR